MFDKTLYTVSDILYIYLAEINDGRIIGIFKVFRKVKEENESYILKYSVGTFKYFDKTRRC